MRVAVIGSGISGLAVAHGLRAQAHVSLFEANDYFGGHTHTVDVTLPAGGGEVTHGVDTGFLVFNERTYPKLIALFAELGVATARSQMSFSVQAPANEDSAALEWSGSSLSSVFAQRRNLLRPAFWAMLRDVLRFNALASRIAASAQESELQQPLAEFLRQHRFGHTFCQWYFLPMMGCIWSCPTRQMLQFPVSTMVRFCHNHGLLQITNRPQWWTVTGGARHYVDKILAGVPDRRLNTAVRRIERHAGGAMVSTDGGTEHFDRVVLAVHSDQALSLLHDATPLERETLGAIRYQANRAVLHTDASVLPTRRAAWAAWNYQRAAQVAGDDDTPASQVCLHYLLNLLQPLPWPQPVVVSLNPIQPIDARQVLGEYHYAHPVFDLDAVKAQAAMPQLQGYGGTYFCGAWMGYGFHEDGLHSGQSAARQLLQQATTPLPAAA